MICYTNFHLVSDPPPSHRNWCNVSRCMFCKISESWQWCLEVYVRIEIYQISWNIVTYHSPWFYITVTSKERGELATSGFPPEKASDTGLVVNLNSHLNQQSNHRPAVHLAMLKMFWAHDAIVKFPRYIVSSIVHLQQYILVCIFVQWTSSDHRMKFNTMRRKWMADLLHMTFWMEKFVFLNN